MSEFKDKVVIVTGASGGLGGTVIDLFAADGAKMVLLDMNKEKLEKVAQEKCKNDYLTFAVNISDEDQIKEVVDKTVEKFGRIDVLINVAGIAGPAVLTEDYSYEDFKKVFAVNVFGDFLTMKYVIPVMKKQKSGAIVNTASTSGMVGCPLEVGYGASKWAVIGLTHDAASENTNGGVRINSVSPGWMKTNMLAEIMENYKVFGEIEKEEDFDASPMGRPGEPIEIANTIYFLASEKASFINGANFVVDGGATIF